MDTKKIAYRDVKKGLMVRRGGNPRTPQGRARKAETFEVVEVQGVPGRGYSNARVRGNCQSFWVHPTSLVEKWERA